jgi:hypothetical protein
MLTLLKYVYDSQTKLLSAFVLYSPLDGKSSEIKVLLPDYPRFGFHYESVNNVWICLVDLNPFDVPKKVVINSKHPLYMPLMSKLFTAQSQCCNSTDTDWSQKELLQLLGITQGQELKFIKMIETLRTLHYEYPMRIKVRGEIKSPALINHVFMTIASKSHQ